jgi:hypothetical protein
VSSRRRGGGGRQIDTCIALGTPFMMHILGKAWVSHRKYSATAKKIGGHRMVSLGDISHWLGLPNSHLVQ